VNGRSAALFFFVRFCVEHGVPAAMFGSCRGVGLPQRCLPGCDASGLIAIALVDPASRCARAWPVSVGGVGLRGCLGCAMAKGNNRGVAVVRPPLLMPTALRAIK
jgi:hypothetical protein